MSKYYSGRVNAIVFENRAQSFYIAKMVLDPEGDNTLDMFGDMSGISRSEPVSVVGNVPGMDLEVGSWFGFEARWERHATHGQQLRITKAPVIKDGWDPDTAMATLSAHGVSELVCDQLRAHFGEDVVNVLDRGDENEISTVPGVSLLSAAHIVSRWTWVKAYFTTLAFLSEAEVPKYKIGEVWAHFQEEAQEVLSTNPWRLVEIDGIRFQQADEVALRLGLDMDSPLRVRGAVLFACKTRRGMGHLYLSTGEMVAEVHMLVSGSTDAQIADAIRYLVEKGDIVIDRTTRPGVRAIYEPWMFKMERESAILIRDRMLTANPLNPPDPKTLHEEVDKVATPYIEKLAKVGETVAALHRSGASLREVAREALTSWSTSAHINLSDTQLQGALNALTEPVSILTGLPGTGKTTTLKSVVSVLKDAGIHLLLCAPTGIAAKRISSVTGANASTIHRAFGAKGWKTGQDRESNYSGVVGQQDLLESSDGSRELWEFGPGNPHPADVIVIDEVSMVDQHIIYRVLTATKPTARIVLVGDAAQLPSVGPGNVLRDMITTGRFPTINLTEIFRQGEQSDIVLAAHAIFRGEVPQVANRPDSDFILLEHEDEDAVLASIINIARRCYEGRRNFQVLSPRHRGKLGVTNLNAELRELINPKGPGLQEMRLGGETIREDDRVMVVKNDYQRGIYNGDVGKVEKLDRKDREVVIKLHGPPVEFVPLPFKMAASHLRMAYAMTVHKSQGQEYDWIIMPVVRGFAHQLQRNLFYTGITRAKERVVLVGQRDAMSRAVYNDREDARNTLFADRIEAAFEGGSGVLPSGTSPVEATA